MKDNKLRKDFEKLIDAMPYMIKYSVQKAKLRKNDYDNYIKVGFTKEEALELCKT